MRLRRTLRVLLVEDNELDARMMLRHLRDADFDEFVARRVTGLAAALDAVGDGETDCVLLDLSLPDSAGLASIDALLERSPQTPVVVLTGIDDPEAAVAAIERGAQDFLTKQRADPLLVARSIRYAVARQHSESQLRLAQEQLNTLHDRERIARDLHDTVIQQLFATGMGLQSLAGRIDDPPVQARLMEAIDRIDDGIRQLREAIFGLHSVVLDSTVSDEIASLVAAQSVSLGFAPTLRLGPGVDDVDGALTHDLLATIREGLSNVAKHAHATAAQVIVTIADGEIVLEVVDNGRGIDVDTSGDPTSVDPASNRAGYGLRNMAARAAELAGGFLIGPAPGGGTVLRWTAPLRPH